MQMKLKLLKLSSECLDKMILIFFTCRYLLFPDFLNASPYSICRQWIFQKRLDFLLAFGEL